MSWSSLKKKEGVIRAFFFVWKKFFWNICVLSQCIVYWIHFHNIHTFTYQKTLLHTLFYLFLKSSKAFSVSLNLRPQKWFKSRPNLIRCFIHLLLWQLYVLLGEDFRNFRIHFFKIVETCWILQIFLHLSIQ